MVIWLCNESQLFGLCVRDVECVSACKRCKYDRCLFWSIAQHLFGCTGEKR